MVCQRWTELRRLPAAGFTRDQPKELPRCCISSAGRLQRVHVLAFLSLSRRTLRTITFFNCFAASREEVMSVEIVTLSSLSSSPARGAGRRPGQQIGLGNALPEKPMFDSLRPFRFFDSFPSSRVRVSLRQGVLNTTNFSCDTIMQQSSSIICSIPHRQGN